MNKKEIDKVLEELNQVNPLHLNDEALRLFNAIMSIADERDLYKTRINKAIEYIEKHQYRWYDLNGEEYIEPTEFDKNVNPKILLEILKGDNNE